MPLPVAPLMIDMHADTPQRFLDEPWEFTSALGSGMINLHTARQAGLDAEFFAIWVDPAEHPGRFAQQALALTDAVLEQVRNHPAELQLCLSAEDIVNARAAGRFGVLLGLEGGHSIENSLALLRTFFRLGCRYMTLTWNNTNEWADSSNDVERHGGLSNFGCEVVGEMNRLGMMVDVSHVSEKTFWRVLEVSGAPVIASHSSSRAITPAARNLTDEQLQALAAHNGVAMVNFFPAFLDPEWDKAWAAGRPERRAAAEAAAKPYREAGRLVPYLVTAAVDRQFAARLPRPRFQLLIDHFDHMMRTAGPGHVGIGTDFDGIPGLPEGIDSAADLPKIGAALLARGYTAEEVQGVLGGNALRVFGEVARYAEVLTSLRGSRSC